MTTIDLTQDLSDAEEQSEELLLGTALFSIVGIRYYKGKCHPGEYIALTREPNNPYDANAVRVDNLRGEKVGHIKRQQALPLSKIMDQYPVSIIIDGTIPSAGDQWTMPLKVDFYGADPMMGQTISSIFKKSGMYLQTSPYKGCDVAALDTDGNLGGVSAGLVVQKRNIDWTTQQKELDDMFDTQCKSQLQGLPLIPTPPQLLVNLLDHQISGLRWMVRNESKPPPVPFYSTVKELGRTMWLSEITNSSQLEAPKPIRGGILADDMGLGKTIQAISLMLSNRPSSGSHYLESNENAAPTMIPSKGMVQKIGIPILQRILSGAGISITSATKEAVVKCCMEALKSGKLSVEAYHAGLNAFKPRQITIHTSTVSQPITTLILCPVSVISNWLQQIEMHVQHGTLRVGMYHGTDRFSVLLNLDTIDVLVASYNTVAHDFGKLNRQGGTEPEKKKTKSTSIFDHTFHRIILDEAHMIRNTKTRLFKACSSLKAELKWALTGTPLQNKVDDLYSLFSFLGVEPLGDSQVFRRAIVQPLMQGDPTGLSRLRVMMAHVALRRNKQAANLNIPEKVVELRAVEFPQDNVHKIIHDTLFRTARFALAATLSDDNAALKNYASIFETLLRIRQACCSGMLVPKAHLERAELVLQEIQGLDETKPLTAVEGMALLEKLKGTFQDEATECAVCLTDMDESECVILRACSHIFCQPCLSKVGEISGKCPFCRVDFVAADMIRKSVACNAVAICNVSVGESTASKLMENIGVSPKIEALLVAIDEMLDDEKGVIFSQFTKFLDEIENHMRARGHTFARIDGTKSAPQRIDAIRKFNSKGDGPRFMICSLHAAGTGINLTRGNHVFMMDTWWNKAVEMQATDRVHRLSQTRNVRIVRFVMANTIEERMVDLQESKAAMSKGAMEKLKPEEVRRLRLGEFRTLFDLHDVSPIEID